MTTPTVLDLNGDRTPTFLLLHGGAGPVSVLPFAHLLAERLDARVLVPTHPGFAGTPRPDDLTSIAGLARLYAGLLSDLDVHDVTVIGNSIGGWIAAELALADGSRLARVVLVNAVGLDVPEHPITDVSGLTPAQLTALSFHRPPALPPGSPRPGPDVRALAAYTSMRMTDPSLRDRLPGIDVPVQVVWGESDGIAGPAYGRAYADAIPGAVFIPLPEAGHLPQLEAPERLLPVVVPESR
ncbi:alpha/beta fold hydrolase [Actinoplanes sp. URMC 104]|uniref:alpha/beta fold hydrolase n=1 Tax=Actinoplanes sp. URMC 104 TaxID=3423409 RepID=UPI003F1C4C9B